MFSRTILAANPSFSHPSEALFWRAFEGACKDRGWTLLKAAARKIPQDSNTFVIPARLVHVAGWLGENYGAGTPDWICEDVFNRYVDWELRRWQLSSHDEGSVKLGLRKLLQYIDRIFRTFRPAICLTTNKIDHGTGLFRDAALYYGTRTLVIERSPLDSIWIEPDGIFAESLIWRLWPKRDSAKDEHWRRLGRRVAIKVATTPAGFRPQKELSLSADRALKHAKRPLVFLPMDNVLWTGWAQQDHPQGKIDYPLFNGPIDAIRELANVVDMIGGQLCVKLHPACQELKAKHFPDGVQLIDGDIQQLLSQCDLVVAFNTKVAFSALAFGIPVVTLSHNPIAAGGVTYHATESTSVLPAIERAISREGFSRILDTYYTFVGWLEAEFFVSIQTEPDFSKPNHITLMHELEQMVKDEAIMDLPIEFGFAEIRDSLRPGV